MSNVYFSFDHGHLVPGDVARAEDVNNIFLEVAAGFDRLPDPSSMFGGSSNYGEATGTNGNYNITIPNISDYSDGMSVSFKASSNGGPASLNVNDIGARAILANDGSQLIPGDIVAGHIYSVRYNNTAGVSGAWELQRETAGEYAANKVVAQNIGAVQNVSANMAAVLSAESNANTASTKASEAAISAAQAANSAGQAAASAAQLPNATTIGAGNLPRVDSSGTGWVPVSVMTREESIAALVLKANQADVQNALTAIEQNLIPIGVIVPFVGGYFTDADNGGYVSVWGNTVAEINALLNPKGWYVCDGAALELPGSPIFGTPGRRLPNLTDSRFILGSAGAGVTGGSNNTAHSHTITHTHRVDIEPFWCQGTTLAEWQMPHHAHTVNHTIWAYAEGSLKIAGTGTRWCNYHDGSTNGRIPLGTYGTGGGGAHSHIVDPPATATTAPTGNPASGEAIMDNRPAFLSCVYIMRVR